MPDKRVYIPTVIPAFLYVPGRRIVEFKIHLKNVPGALMSVMEVFYKHKVNIMSSWFPNNPTEESGYWTLFADYTGVFVPLEEFKKELKRKRKVIDVEYVEAENFLVDAFHFKVETPPMGRVFTLNVDLYAEIVKALRETFGSAADFILFMQGVKYGEAAIKRYREAFPLLSRVSRDDIVKFLVEIPRVVGYADVEIKKANLDEGLLYAVAYSLFECEPFKGQLNTVNSQFFRGMMTGAVRTLTGREDYVVIEEECVAKDDPYCSFKLQKAELKPKATL